MGLMFGTESNTVQKKVNGILSKITTQLRDIPAPKYRAGETVWLRLKDGEPRVSIIKSGIFVSNTDGWLYKLQYMLGMRRVGCSRYERQLNKARG